MAKSDEVVAAWAEIDTATTEAGQRVQLLIDQINATAGVGLDGPQTEAVLANLVSHKNWLTSLGHNLQVPIPPTPPEGPAVR